MRGGGVLLPLSSLPGPYGIGSMGQEARDFVDFLVLGGQSYWQMLPIGPTSYGDSPYQSFSTFAGNPYFIDLAELCREGLLTDAQLEEARRDGGEGPVDYGRLYETRYPLLRQAHARFRLRPPVEFEEFRQNSPWLEDYSLFMALKDRAGGAPWGEWDEPLRAREPAAMAAARKELREEISFWEMVQYLFYRQWRGLKTYANNRGIRIIGDLPIYVALDSADVWAAPEQFLLDQELRPLAVAGCPPDGFTAEGQLWGNPLFRWDVMAEDGYDWWIRRIAHTTSIFDVTRIDHFRGFESYYAIPAGAPDARQGEWRPGPGMALFRAAERRLGRRAIIAEDLGFLTDGVRRLLAESGFPGMKVLEFAFDSREESDYLPHNYSRDCVVYVGTHDNDTALGWMETASREDTAFAKEYLRLTPAEGWAWGLMRGAWSSVADTAVVQMQDLLELGSEARMNTPSTLGENWRWRMAPGAASPELARRLRRQMELYGRIPRP
jgi:4-alpha-glucanotransferase